MKFPPQVNQTYWTYKIDFGALKRTENTLDSIFVHYIKVKIKARHADSFLFEENVTLDVVGVYDKEHYSYADNEFNVPLDRIFDTKEEAQLAVKQRMESRIFEIKEKIKNEYRKLWLYENAVNQYTNTESKGYGGGKAS